MITYRFGNDLDLDAVIELYRASTLGERRPVDDRGRMAWMLNHANLVVTAWEGDLLVGIARSVSDFSYCTYLSDLAVRDSHQRRGIGRELIRRTRARGGPATIILLAAPKAVDYYPRLGFKAHPSAWMLGADHAIPQSRFRRHIAHPTFDSRVRRATRVNWLLYCRQRRPAYLQVTFKRGEHTLCSEFKVKYGRTYDLTICGTLLGEEYSLAAFGRKRRPEDRSEAELVFEGTFEQANGCSGEFSAYPGEDGGMMSLGAYGLKSIATLRRMGRRLRDCPLELVGVPEVSLRLESGLCLPGLSGRRDYVGVLRSSADDSDVTPPMVTVTTTLVLCYKELLRAHYLEGV